MKLTFLLSCALLLAPLSLVVAQPFSMATHQIALQRRTNVFQGPAIRSSDGSSMYMKLKADRITPSPAIDSTTLYVGTESGIIAAFVDMGVAVVGKADGAVNAAPAIRNGSLFAGSSDGALYAFNLTSDQLEWKFKGGGAFTTTPLAVDNLLIAGCDDRFIYAIDAGTSASKGSLKWKYQLAGKPTAPAWKDGVIYVGTDEPATYAIDGATGTVKWKTDGWGGQIVLGTWQVFAAGKTGLAMLNNVSGSPVWKVLETGEGSVQISANDDVVVAVLSNGTVVGFDPEEGTQRWELDGAERFLSAAALCQDVGYVVDFTWNLIAFNLSDGGKLWEQEVGFGYGGMGTPALLNGTLYVATPEKLVMISSPETDETVAAENVPEVPSSDDDSNDPDASWFDAAKQGGLEQMNHLLSGGTAVDTTNEFGETALMMAGWTGNIEVVGMLLERGADVNKRDVHGVTPVMHAAWEGQTSVVKVLLERGGRVNDQDTSGQTAIAHAAWEGKDETVRLLLENGANPDIPDNYGMTPLMHAAIEGSDGSIRLLVEAKANVAAISSAGKSAMGYAIDHNKTETVRLLYASGATLPGSDSLGRTPLMNHAAVGNTEMVQLLIDIGANPNTRANDGETALHKAVLQESFPTVQLLLEQRVDPNAASTAGETPLIYAAYRANPELVATLLKAGASVHHSDNDGYTPLMFATQTKCAQCVKLMLAKKPDLNKKNVFEDTALSIATKNGDKEIVGLLKKAGAK
ncbi:MAG: ankyrin repeat domain-containing protein [Armatimonadetes bacterium]|nr:ankyrin repeat domain-containing protein [Armatimonadota bacterium]